MIYLDHAATSFPKPAAVVQAVQRWFIDIGVSADRGDGARTREAGAVVHRVRQQLAALTGHPSHRVALLSGATEGLNLALRALLRAGDRVLTTAFEHSSVVRPLMALADELELELDIISPTDDGAPPIDQLCQQLARRPRLLVFTHGSNVTGAIFDAAALCRVAKQHGVLTLLDASQSIGYLPTDVGADVVVASGHKALHGPPGIGFVTTTAELQLAPQKQGGTGSSVALDRHPDEWPQAFEAGTPNTPAIFGLAAALDWLAERGRDSLLAASLARTEQLLTGLRAIEGLRVIEPRTERRLPVISVVHPDYDPLELGAVLAQADVHVRSGFHCAPWLHRELGTAHGTLRLSPGPMTTAAECDTALELLRSC